VAAKAAGGRGNTLQDALDRRAHPAFGTSVANHHRV